MRYYLVTIQYNREAQAENRTVPKAFDSLNDAEAEFHSQVAKDMKNSILGWSLNMVINDDGGVYLQKKYVAEPLPIEEPTEE